MAFSCELGSSCLFSVLRFLRLQMGAVLITKLLGRGSLLPAACLALCNQELKTIAFAGEDPLGLEIEGLLKRRALL